MSRFPIREIFALAAGMGLLACSAQPPLEEPAVATRVTTVARSTMAAEDGVAIAYEVRGSGEVALVFVHCWACDRSFWKEQLDVFDDDFLVVALDLPGHGFSGRRPAGTILDLGRDVAQVVRTLGLRRVILVGHSMGGPVSLAAAQLLGGTVEGVIGLDTLHNAELAPPPGMVEQMTAAFEGDFEATMEGFVRSAMPEAADPALVSWLVAKARGANREVAVELMKDFPNLDLPSLFLATGVPIRCINAAPRGQDGVATEVDVNRRYADFDAELVQGVGHFLHLENPLEINVRIRRVVDELLTARLRPENRIVAALP